MIDDPLMFGLIRRVKRLEQEIDSLVKPEVGRWVDWTPTVDQNGSVAATVTEAKYIIDGDTVHAYARLDVTGSGTAGNAITIGSLPATPELTSSRFSLGTYNILNGGIDYSGVTVPSTGPVLGFRSDQAGLVGVNPSFALANGDDIFFSVTYKRA